MKYFSSLLFCSLFGLLANTALAQQDSLAHAWANSMYNQMSVEEKIGQLFFLRAHSNLKQDHVNAIKNAITKHNVGGLCFFQGTPEKQIDLINTYQSMSKYPIMMTMDAEWGTGMRFKEDGFSFPKQLTLGAIQDEQVIYQMGNELAEHLKKVGVQVNFAPVVDVNNNPKNPVINVRSFGEDKYNVTKKAYAYAKGMQDRGVMACLKHFPGHGDTDVDSHYDLPIINHSKERLEDIELFPFEQLGKQGIQSVMVAHLNIPAFDSTKNLPTTLSPKVVDDILVKKFGYQGLIFTDALDMKGVAKYHKDGDAEAKAFLAGNDVLLLPENIPQAVTKIKAMLKDGVIDEARLARSVKKILYYKYITGLNDWKPLQKGDVRTFLNRPEGTTINRKLYKNALTLAKDTERLLPLRAVNPKVVSIAFGATKETPFQERLKSYAEVSAFQFAKGAQPSKVTQGALDKADYVIASFHDMSNYASRKYGISQSQVDYLKKVAATKKVIIVAFGSPYALHYFDDFNTVLQAYEGRDDMQDLAAQGLFGVFGFQGKLPVAVTEQFKLNQGIQTVPLGRVGYSTPEEVGMTSNLFYRVDSLANRAIEMRATPGCVVLAAKAGKVVFHKAYGYHTYERRQPMQKDAIFDVASITKVAASTASVMKLQEQGSVNIRQTLGTQFDYVKQSPLAGLSFEDVLRHRSGLTPWLRFYEATLIDPEKNKRPSLNYYQTVASTSFPTEVAKDLYLKNGYRDTMLQKILNSPLKSNPTYKYSDLGMILMDKLVEEKTGMRIDAFAEQTYYKPLGMSRTTYNAAKKFPLSEIPPTEMDDYFRRQKVHGYVHDMAAAMMHGVSGHAGLFSTAEDLNKLFTMFLQGGMYGGQRFLADSTIHQFTQRCSDCTRRGIGFDMKQLDEAETLNMSSLASSRAFGHLGFTGTAVWADPEHDLVVIFLSNRTFPTMNNPILGREDFRPKIQSVFYESIGVTEEKP